MSEVLPTVNVELFDANFTTALCPELILVAGSLH